MKSRKIQIKQRILEGGQSKVIIQEEEDRVDVIFNKADEKRTKTLEKIQELQNRQELQNIIQIKDAEWDQEGKIIKSLILQKAEETLEQKIKRDKTLSENDKIQLMHQIALGVNELHTNQILHRDLKEDNILMVKNKAKIGDLGFVRHMDKIDVDILGTCFNSLNAPTDETISQHYGSPSDIFALGALFSFIYTGHQLSGDQKTTLQKQNKINENLQSSRGQYSQTITKLISSMIETEAQERSKLEYVLEKLNEIVNGQETQRNQAMN